MRRLAVLALICAPALAQKPAAPIPRTAAGHPDLQGIWSAASLTPFERPAAYAGREFFTEQEAAEYAKRRIAEGDKDRRDGGAEADVARSYNNLFYDHGEQVTRTRRTSLVIDPPDGRIPPMTPEGDRKSTRLNSSHVA